jgi:hypothetical protein
MHTLLRQRKFALKSLQSRLLYDFIVSNCIGYTIQNGRTSRITIEDNYCCVLLRKINNVKKILTFL